MFDYWEEYISPGTIEVPLVLRKIDGDYAMVAPDVLIHEIREIFRIFDETGIMPCEEIQLKRYIGMLCSIVGEPREKMNDLIERIEKYFIYKNEAMRGCPEPFPCPFSLQEIEDIYQEAMAKGESA